MTTATLTDQALADTSIPLIERAMLFETKRQADATFSIGKHLDAIVAASGGASSGNVVLAVPGSGTAKS